VESLLDELGLGGSASLLVLGLKSKVGMGCATAVSDTGVADTSSGGSMNSPGVPSPAESVIVEGLPRTETAKSSSNSSP
jgi:hypothetical protein